jgi:hypothetical protein
MTQKVENILEISMWNLWHWTFVFMSLVSTSTRQAYAKCPLRVRDCLNYYRQGHSFLKRQSSRKCWYECSKHNTPWEGFNNVASQSWQSRFHVSLVIHYLDSNTLSGT